MSKSSYCGRYNHKACVQYGHAATCDCECGHETGDVPESAVEEATVDISEADAEVFRYVERLKNRTKPTVEPPAPKGSLDAAAQTLLDALYKVDPTWEERDRACAAETMLTPAQRLLKYVGLVLDRQLQMDGLSGYDFLEPGAQPSGQLVSSTRAECPQCHKDFERKVPGQICCSNECGDLYHPKPKPKVPEFQDEFNRFIESQATQATAPVDPIRNDVGIPAPGVLR
jgi:hypothetical protein